MPSVANLLITGMKCQLTMGDFIANKMKTRDINVMPSFNGFSVVNTAADLTAACLQPWSPVVCWNRRSSNSS